MRAVSLCPSPSPSFVEILFIERVSRAAINCTARHPSPSAERKDAGIRGMFEIPGACDASGIGSYSEVAGPRGD